MKTFKDYMKMFINDEEELFYEKINENYIPLPDESRLENGFALLVDYETAVKEQCKKLGS